MQWQQRFCPLHRRRKTSLTLRGISAEARGLGAHDEQPLAAAGVGRGVSLDDAVPLNLQLPVEKGLI